MRPDVASRWEHLTLVPDVDGVIAGDPRIGTYVAIPLIGAEVLRWLQQGLSLAEATTRAGELAGEDVDVEGFVRELEDQGVLERTGIRTADRRPSPVLCNLGRLLFGRAGWTVMCCLSLAGVVVLTAGRGVRPRGADLIVSANPLVSILAGSALAIGCIVVHEMAHVLAAAARGVPTRLSISRRLYFVTAQADLTGLWSLPRRRRLAPLLAGLAVDGASAGAILLVEAGGLLPSSVLPVARYLVAIQVASLVLQCAVFMRTDVYAVVLVATGSRNLWVVKDAVLRAGLGVRRAGDHALLAATSDRERRLAGWFLALYLPGLGLAIWYLLVIMLPAMVRLSRLTMGGFSPFDLGRTRTWESMATLILVLGPNAFALAAALTSSLRRRHR